MVTFEAFFTELQTYPAIYSQNSVDHGHRLPLFHCLEEELEEMGVVAGHAAAASFGNSFGKVVCCYSCVDLEDVPSLDCPQNALCILEIVLINNDNL